MTNSQKLEYLAGQVNAMMTFVIASINSHPDISSLAQEYRRLSEAQVSSSLFFNLSYIHSEALPVTWVVRQHYQSLVSTQRGNVRF
jgi:hypothetical protein